MPVGWIVLIVIAVIALFLIFMYNGLVRLRNMVDEARNAAVSAQQAGPAAAGQSAQAENILTGALRQLFALVENYPQLKANENVMQLQEELTTTENQIGFSRQQYNTSIQTFPNALLAGIFGFHARDYFQIAEEDTAVPQVDLSLKT